MMLLGLLLAAVVAAFTALLIAYNTGGGPEYTVTMFDQDVVTLNSLAIFCAGLALALLFCLGLAMMAMSRRRARRHRRFETSYGSPPQRQAPPPAAPAEPQQEWAADQDTRSSYAAARHGEADAGASEGEQPPRRRWFHRG